jgi:hypothetical protein
MIYNIILFRKTNTMDTDKIAQEISEELVRIWNEFEKNEHFYNCTEDGVFFDFMKCTERRVATLGSSVMYSFETAQNKLFKAVLLDGFSRALLSIHYTAKELKSTMEDEQIAIHFAGIRTLREIALQLSESLD